MIDKPAVYFPVKDEEYEQTASSMLNTLKFTLYQEALFGGEGKLGQLDPSVKLYLLMHSNYELSVFWSEGRSYTAAEMAELMESDGFNKKHRDLELLVCNAGVSLNTQRSQQRLAELYAALVEARASGNQQAITRARAAYNAVVVNAAPPQEFTDQSFGRVLPLAAQLVDELKTRGYDYLRVTSYKCPVAMSFSQGIRLDLKDYGGLYGTLADSAEGVPYRVVWL